MKQELLYPISKLPIMANALYTYFLFHFCVISLNLYYQITYIHSQYYLISELKEQDLNQIHEKTKRMGIESCFFYNNIHQICYGVFRFTKDIHLYFKHMHP